MRHRYLSTWLVVVLVLGLTAGATALAQEDDSGPAAPAADYSIDRATVDGGGETSTGGAYSLTATIGQPDAGPGADGMAGGTYALKGGFWTVSTLWVRHQYLPMIVRD